MSAFGNLLNELAGQGFSTKNNGNGSASRGVGAPAAAASSSSVRQVHGASLRNASNGNAAAGTNNIVAAPGAPAAAAASSSSSGNAAYVFGPWAGIQGPVVSSTGSAQPWTGTARKPKDIMKDVTDLLAKNEPIPDSLKSEVVFYAPKHFLVLYEQKSRDRQLTPDLDEILASISIEKLGVSNVPMNNSSKENIIVNDKTKTYKTLRNSLSVKNEADLRRLLDKMDRVVEPLTPEEIKLMANSSKRLNNATTGILNAAGALVNRKRANKAGLAQYIQEKKKTSQQKLEIFNAIHELMESDRMFRLNPDILPSLDILIQEVNKASLFLDYLETIPHEDPFYKNAKPILSNIYNNLNKFFIQYYIKALNNPIDLNAWAGVPVDSGKADMYGNPIMTPAPLFPTNAGDQPFSYLTEGALLTLEEQYYDANAARKTEIKNLIQDAANAEAVLFRSDTNALAILSSILTKRGEEFFPGEEPTVNTATEVLKRLNEHDKKYPLRGGSRRLKKTRKTNHGKKSTRKQSIPKRR